MDRENPATSHDDARKFEPPQLTRLGRVTQLTQAFEPGTNTDFTLSSF